MDVYAHVLPGMGEQVASAIETALGGRGLQRMMAKPQTTAPRPRGARDDGAVRSSNGHPGRHPQVAEGVEQQLEQHMVAKHGGGWRGSPESSGAGEHQALSPFVRRRDFLPPLDPELWGQRLADWIRLQGELP